MTRNYKTSVCLAGGFFTLLSACNNESEKKDGSPNIILILCDDMGYSDISPFGSEISTPGLQKLADNGMIMTRFYNASRCCPSRASLLTGLYPHQTGLAAMADQRFDLEGYQGYLSDHCITIAEALKERGYTTFMSGKWHVGDEPGSKPHDRGFDHSLAFLNGASSYYNIRPYRDSSWLDVTGNITLRMELDGKGFCPPDSGWYATDAYTDYAMDFIRNRESKDSPFFLYLAYTAPHWPLHAPEEDILKYLGKYREGWTKLRESRYRRMLQSGLIDSNTALSPQDSKWLDWESFTDDQKDRYDRKMAVYAAMIDRMDQNISRLMLLLEEEGIDENTIIMFLSDNGGDRSDEIGHTSNYDKSGPIGSPQSFAGYGPGWANVSNTPFREAKAHTFFGGIATPFIVVYPGVVPAGSVSGFQANIIDIMPTILDITGTGYPAEYKGNELHPLPGTSLLPVWKGIHAKRTVPLFFEHFGSRAVIREEWKLVSYPRQDWELYNIEDDPVELYNLASTEQKKRDELISLYGQWADSLTVLDIEDHEAHKIK